MKRFEVVSGTVALCAPWMPVGCGPMQHAISPTDAARPRTQRGKVPCMAAQSSSSHHQAGYCPGYCPAASRIRCIAAVAGSVLDVPYWRYRAHVMGTAASSQQCHHHRCMGLVQSPELSDVPRGGCCVSMALPVGRSASCLLWRVLVKLCVRQGIVSAFLVFGSTSVLQLRSLCCCMGCIICIKDAVADGLCTLLKSSLLCLGYIYPVSCIILAFWRCRLQAAPLGP